MFWLILLDHSFLCVGFGFHFVLASNNTIRCVRATNESGLALCYQRLDKPL
jgi:hypothetical protein